MEEGLFIIELVATNDLQSHGLMGFFLISISDSEGRSSSEQSNPGELLCVT
jgi:hypothetical protein